jgi:hypothetical protein
VTHHTSRFVRQQKKEVDSFLFPLQPHTSGTEGEGELNNTARITEFFIFVA